MNIHTPPAKTIASVIFAAAGSPNYAHMITDDVIAHAATAMDKIAKAEVAAAVKAGNISKRDPNTRPGGPSISLRLARMIADGPMTREALGKNSGMKGEDVSNGLNYMRQAVLIEPSYKIIKLTAKGREWLARQEAILDGANEPKISKLDIERLKVLRTINGGQTITKDVAEALGKDKSLTGARIREMIRNGLLISNGPADTSKPRILSLTIKGREMLEAHQ